MCQIAPWAYEDGPRSGRKPYVTNDLTVELGLAQNQAHWNLGAQYGEYEIAARRVACEDNEGRVDGSMVGTLRRPDEVQVWDEVG